MFVLALSSCGPRSSEVVAPTRSSVSQLSEAEAYQRAIALAAEELLRSESAFIVKPKFELDPAQAVIHYRLGGIVSSAFGTDNPDGFVFATCARVQIALLKQVFQKEGVPQDVWYNALLALKAIENRAAEHNDTPLDEQGWFRVRNHFQLQLAELDKRVQGYADSIDVAVEREELDLDALWAVDREKNGSGFEIKLNTQPEGGKIRLIKHLTFLKETYLGKTDQEISWVTQLSPKVTMMGRYNYWVTWPDGREARGVVEVTNSNELTFLPDE